MTNDCRFVWHDLSTHDVEAAKRFYGELFDWSFDSSENDPYHHVVAGEQMIGGVRRKDANEPGPPSWLGYVLVDDVADAVERAKAGGGTVYVPTTTMPGVGTFAVVADPTGGVVAPWRSARSEENEAASSPPPPHTFCWDALTTTDAPAATAFYTRVFGWDTETRDRGERGNTTLFRRPGAAARAGGLTTSPPEAPFSFWLAHVRVEDTDAAAERATRLGATITMPPTDVPEVGRSCTFRDPEGATLAILSLPGA